MTLRFNWGTGIALAYTTFAVATMGFVAFAMTRPVDLVSTDYYGDALRHDATASARANATALGETFDIAVDDVARHVVVTWPAAMAPNVTGTATFYRPSSAGLDREMALAPDASGSQTLPTGDLVAGRWQLRISWQAEGRQYLAVRDLHLR